MSNNDQDRPVVNVSISGYANTGKSTIAAIIAQALDGLGISTEVIQREPHTDDKLESDPLQPNSAISNALTILKERGVVVQVFDSDLEKRPMGFDVREELYTQERRLKYIRKTLAPDQQQRVIDELYILLSPTLPEHPPSGMLYTFRRRCGSVLHGVSDKEIREEIKYHRTLRDLQSSD